MTTDELINWVNKEQNAFKKKIANWWLKSWDGCVIHIVLCTRLGTRVYTHMDMGRVNNAELASPAVRESSHFTTSSLGNPQNLILLLILMFFHFENVVYMREVAHFFKGTHTHPHSKSPSARGIIWYLSTTLDIVGPGLYISLDVRPIKTCHSLV